MRYRMGTSFSRVCSHIDAALPVIFQRNSDTVLFAVICDLRIITLLLDYPISLCSLSDRSSIKAIIPFFSSEFR